MYVHTHIFVNVQICIYMCVYTYAYVCMCVYVYKYMCVYIYTPYIYGYKNQFVLGGTASLYQSKEGLVYGTRKN